MKLGYILDNLDKPETDGYINFDLFVRELNLPTELECQWPGDKNEKLRSYWIAAHQCTDTWVGYRAYFLEGVLVCVTHQSARKSHEYIMGWVSKDLAEKTRDYLLTLYDLDCDYEVELLDPEFEMGLGYEVQFNDSLVTKEVLYQGVRCAVVNQRRTTYQDMHNITILVGDSKVSVDVRDTLTPFNVKKSCVEFKRTLNRDNVTIVQHPGKVPCSNAGFKGMEVTIHSQNGIEAILEHFNLKDPTGEVPSRIHLSGHKKNETEKRKLRKRLKNLQEKSHGE